MASFSSILSSIGHGLKVFFTDATKVAVVAAPIVDILFPGIAGLYNATVSEVGKVEGLAAAAGAQTGTGAQKLALVVQAIEAEYAAYAKANGITYDVTKIEAWVSAVVGTLNAVPSGTPAP